MRSIFSLVMDALPTETQSDTGFIPKSLLDADTTAKVKPLGKDIFKDTESNKSANFLISFDLLRVHAESFGDIEEAEKRIGLAILLYKRFLPTKNQLAFMTAYFMAGKQLQQRESFRAFLSYFGLVHAREKVEHYRNKLQQNSPNVSEEEMLDCFNQNSRLPIDNLNSLKFL
ncbi:MAG: hypothetical protein ACSNEK_06745 [Parachlamydiaceae bacterium]